MCVYFHLYTLCVIDSNTINTSEAADGQNIFLYKSHVESTSISSRMCVFGH